MVLLSFHANADFDVGMPHPAPYSLFFSGALRESVEVKRCLLFSLALLLRIYFHKPLLL